MADATDDIAGEQAVRCIGHTEHPIGLALVSHRMRLIHMHRNGVPSPVDLPFVAHVGAEVIEQGEVFQVLVPPIDTVAVLVDELLVGPRRLVVHRVGLGDDLDPFAVDGGIGGIFEMLVGDVTCDMLDFVIPFGAAGEGFQNIIRIANTLPIFASGIEIQMVVGT